MSSFSSQNFAELGVFPELGLGKLLGYRSGYYFNHPNALFVQLKICILQATQFKEWSEWDNEIPSSSDLLERESGTTCSKENWGSSKQNDLWPSSPAKQLFRFQILQVYSGEGFPTSLCCAWLAICLTFPSPHLSLAVLPRLSPCPFPPSFSPFPTSPLLLH